MTQTGNAQTLAQAIAALGMQNGIICLHSSLKSFGRLANGPQDVIAAFLQNGCTLLVPTFTYDCEMPTPPGRELRQNAENPADAPDPAQVTAYNPASNQLSNDMGAIPAALLQNPGRARGDHPLNSFAALGPQAQELIAPQNPFNVYAPFKFMREYTNTWLVLAGVGLTRATAIHYAEKRSGRRLFRRWGKNAQGQTIETEVGSCSEGFENLAPFVAHLEARAQVAQSPWRIYPFRAFVDVVENAIRQNPSITRCADPNCERCRDAILGGPLA